MSREAAINTMNDDSRKQTHGLYEKSVRYIELLPAPSFDSSGPTNLPKRTRAQEALQMLLDPITKEGYLSSEKFWNFRNATLELDKETKRNLLQMACEYEEMTPACAYIVQSTIKAMPLPILRSVRSLSATAPQLVFDLLRIRKTNDREPKAHINLQNPDPSFARCTITRLLSAVPEYASILDHHGNTPVHIVCRDWHPVSFLQSLLKTWRPAASTYNNDHDLPLHVVGGRDHNNWCDRWTLLLQTAPETIKLRDGHGHLPLHRALQAGGCGIDVLLDAWPASVLDVHQGSQRTALHMECAKRGRIDVVQKLLAISAEPALMRDSTGCVPIHIACLNAADLSVVDLLLNAGPEALTVITNLGQAPLHFAAGIKSEHRLDVVQRMLYACPAMAAQNDNEGWTPLVYACLVPSLATDMSDLTVVYVLMRTMPSQIRLRKITPIHTKTHAKAFVQR